MSRCRYIFKHPLPLSGEPTLCPGTPISVGTDPDGNWAAWFATDHREWLICTVPTGGEHPPGWGFMDTFVDRLRGLVVHVFTRPSEWPEIPE